MSSNYLNHTATAEHRHSIESAKRHVLNWLFEVFPDHRFDIEDAVAYGDRVTVREVTVRDMCSGTHEG